MTSSCYNTPQPDSSEIVIAQYQESLGTKERRVLQSFSGKKHGRTGFDSIEKARPDCTPEEEILDMLGGFMGASETELRAWLFQRFEYMPWRPIVMVDQGFRHLK